MNKVIFRTLSLVAIITSIGFTVWISRSSFFKSKKFKKRNIQKKDLHFLKTASTWKNIGKLKNIWIYPVKSCAGLSPTEAIIEKEGLRTGVFRDRALMIVDKDGLMLTGRKVSATVLISCKYDPSENIITLIFSELQPITINLGRVESEANLAWTKVWFDRVCGYDCGDEAAAWLALALKRECRLLYHGSIPPQRTMESVVNDYPLINAADSALYGDLSPLMLMNTSSIVDLGKKACRELPPQNFRPNLLVEGPAPYDEDQWTYVRIGEAILHYNNPCKRCVFPTIDYETGKRDAEVEPLRTLRKYRMLEGPNRSPCFGIDLGVDVAGRVEVGDDVYVLLEESQGQSR